jgi:hypothetical protein
MEKIKVSSWNDGKHDTRGNGYGIRVGKRNRYLFENITEFELSIEGNNSFNVSLSPGFWRNCPEFRNSNIGKWMHENNFAPWSKGDNPKFTLTKISGEKFRLDRF